MFEPQRMTPYIEIQLLLIESMYFKIEVLIDSFSNLQFIFEDKKLKEYYTKAYNLKLLQVLREGSK